MNCPICDSKSSEVVYHNPASSFSHSSGYFGLKISLCRACGFVFQSSAQSADYDKRVSEVYQMYRQKNDNFAFPRRCPDYRDTLRMICAHFPRKGKVNVLEIGSNRGDMLYLIKEKFPRANVLGVEPTSFENLAVPTLSAFFSKDLFSNKFEVVILQHVLEHIKRPREFLREVSSVLAEDGFLYIEVPNVENTLRYRTEDFIADHVNYFSPSSISAAMKGLTIIDLKVKPFLRVVAEAGWPQASRLRKPDTTAIKKDFALYRSKKEELIKRIADYSAAGKKIVFYGVSTYFRILFQELRPLLKKENCFYYDDNFKAGREASFGLPRLAELDGRCVIVICSNVYRVQENIAAQLKRLKGIVFIRPWLGEFRT
jgi:SAM-dependent methyltransferase